MATTDELAQLDRDLRALKIEYEQFFGGGRSRPPADTQWRVDTLIRRYNERVAELSVADRFRFNNLAQTYAKYQDMWRKKLAQKEGGVSDRHYGSAARAIQAERSRRTAGRDGAAPSSDAPAQGAPAADVPFSIGFSDPLREKEKVQELYLKVVEARAASGESSATPSLEEFHRFVYRKTKELQAKGARQVEYVVSVEGGRFKLKARVSA